MLNTNKPLWSKSNQYHHQYNLKNTSVTVVCLFMFGLILGMFQFSPVGISLAATTAVPVSEAGAANSLAYSDSTRKVAVSAEGDIYLAYHGENGLRVSHSTNRGLNFLPSVQVTPFDREAEIAVTNNGYIYLVYSGSEGYYILSRSFDKGAHFYPISVVGKTYCGTAHLATDGANIYVLDRCGTEMYRNDAYGVGGFESTGLSSNGIVFSEVQADLATHQVYVEGGGGTTSLRLTSSQDRGRTFGPVSNLGKGGFANPTSALSNGPNGNFLFFGGGQSDGQNGDQAFRVNLNNPDFEPLIFGWNTKSRGRSLVADQYGNLIDGYHSSSSAVSFQVSRDLGLTFEEPVQVSANAGAINVAINDVFGDVIAVYESQGRILANIYPDILAVPDLALSLTTDNPQPNYAQAASFDVKVSNNGRVEAHAIQVKVEMPAGLKQVSQATSLGSYQPATGVWNIVNLAKGQSARLTILTWVTQSNFKPIVSAKLLGATPEDQSPTNNEQVLNLSVPSSADTGLDLNLAPTLPSPGETVQITLHAVNHGPDAATGTRISIDWPDGLDFLGYSTGSGTYLPENHLWNIDVLPIDQPATLVLTGRVNTTKAFDLGTLLTSQDQYDSNSINNSVKIRPGVAAGADIAIQIMADNSRPLFGQDVNFTVMATNQGPGQASGVMVLDRLPEGLLYKSSIASQGTYNPVSGIWNIGSIGAGQATSLKITGQVRTAGTMLTNEARLVNLDQVDPNPANNIQAVTLEISPAYDLSLSASADNLYSRVGQNVLLNLVARNLGPGSLPDSNVINIKVPVGLNYLSNSVSQGKFNPDSGQWTFGSLAAGEEASLQIKALVSQGGALTVSFSLADPNQDLDRSNNNANLTIYGQNWIPLDGVAAQLRVTPDREFSLAPGNLLTYRLLVKNLAGEERENVTLRFPVNSNLELAGVTFSDPLVWVRKVEASSPEPYIEMQLPDLQVQEMVTATVQFRAKPGASPGLTIFSRFSVQVSEPEGESYTTLSNSVRLTLTGNSNRDESGGSIQFFTPQNLTTGTATRLKLIGDFYTPGEKITLWYTDEKGLSVALGDIYADKKGQIAPYINLEPMAKGQSYVVAGYGNQSEVIGSAVITITGQSGPEVKSYTVRPLNPQELIKQLSQAT
ncbi:MAG: DUF11 domain-containing protein [Chloroflexi bacterium]|nr:DUF11 domain-containing protein [Chloroflexota bacterium]OJV92116.1 MAG: hypothetical protein BGO39_09305 [Chloroflexi bacterium 54-19]